MAGQRKETIFFDLTLRLELTLDGYQTDLRTEKRFQENDHLGVFCCHVGYDSVPRGFVKGTQKWGKVLGRAFLHANSVLRRANYFGMPKIDVKSHSLPIPTLLRYSFSKFEE